MEAKLKAEELVDKFKNYCDVDDPNGILTWEECLKYNAKQCALIAVDEILQYIGEEDFIYPSPQFEYWQEVKNEINKL